MLLNQQQMCRCIVALQVLVAAVISITDVVGLWYAISKFTHRNISNSHKFQAVGLGEQAVRAGKQLCGTQPAEGALPPSCIAGQLLTSAPFHVN